MQSVEFLENRASAQPRDDPSRIDGSEDSDWIDRLKDCNQRIDDLRLRYRDIVSVQAKKWNDYVSNRLEQKKPSDPAPQSRIPNPCSSTPISLGTAAPTRQGFGYILNSPPAGEKIVSSPSNRIDLFGNELSHEVVYEYDSACFADKGNSEPDDDFAGRPIGRLGPNTMKDALANQVLDQQDLSFIEVNEDSIGCGGDRDQTPTRPGTDPRGIDASRNLDWIDRLKDCRQMIDDLRARYRDIISVQAEKWKAFVPEPLEQRKVLSRLSRIPDPCSSTPVSVGPTQTARSRSNSVLDPPPLAEANLVGATSNRIDLFGEDFSHEVVHQHDSARIAVEINLEPDDDFAGRPIGRLGPDTMKNALGLSKLLQNPVPTQ